MIRREPITLMGWIAIWVLALVVVTVIQLLTIGHGATPTLPKGGATGLVARFGPLWPLLVTTVFVLIMMSTSTLYRAVLTPDEHGWHLFKLGAAEVRLAIVTIVISALLLFLGSAPSLVLLFFAKPVLRMFPGSGPFVVPVGTLATVCLDIWIAVRLSLAPVHTFAEGRFHVLGYWRLTQGNFWRLFQSYAYLAVQIMAVFLAVFLGLVAVGWLAEAIASGHLSLIDRIALFALVGVAALFLAIGFVIPLTLVCACQALAYAAIVKPDPAQPWGPSSGGAWPRRDPVAPRHEV